MDKVITIGKRLLPVEHIAFVEPYDPATNPKLQTSRAYQARIVLINRDSVLTEHSTKAFAEAHRFRLLEGDQIATNPAVSFRVETFKAADGFTPSKPYATRLLWRDQDGNDQSKLLLAAPELVVAVVLRGDTFAPSDTPSGQDVDRDALRPPRRRQAAASAEVTPQQ